MEFFWDTLRNVHQLAREILAPASPLVRSGSRWLADLNGPHLFAGMLLGVALLFFLWQSIRSRRGC